MSSNIGVKKYSENAAADSKMKSQPAMKTLRAILGLAGFYRRLIQVFGKIEDRLYKLLNKNNVFLGAKSVKKQLNNWSKHNRKTVLGFPNDNDPYTLTRTNIRLALAQIFPKGYISLWGQKSDCTRKQKAL